MKAKHQSYIKKALSYPIEWKTGRDSHFVQEFVKLHHEMTMDKSLSSYRASAPEISALCKHLDEQAIIFTGYFDGEALTSYLIVLCGQKAFTVMAATGRKGREIGASYGVLVQLLDYLINRGITQFDLGGLDPRTPGTEGSNHFKRGFGGKFVEYVGEWEWSSTEWVRWVTNFAIWFRGKRL